MRITSQEFGRAVSDLNVMIIGDVMVDSYLWGATERISPEAPVPVVSVKSREKRLGGAANVARNVGAMGAAPFLCAVIGEDVDGTDFLSLLKGQGYSSEGIVQSPHRVTSIKHRIIASSQHVLRVDQEQTDGLALEIKESLLEKIKHLLPLMDVVIFQDYDKGVIDQVVIDKVTKWAHEQEVYVVVDPKKRNFLNYHHSDLFKPNLKELAEGLNVDLSQKEISSIEDAAQELLEKIKAKEVMITLSEKGVLLVTDQETHHIPAHLRNISDVSGAGDSVIAVAALAKAMELSPVQCAELSNLAGGLVCEQVGVVPIDLSALMSEAQKLKIL